VTRRHDRLALWLLFGVYLVLLAWIILFKLHLPFIGRDDMRGIKLIPFVASEGFGASSPLEVVGNAAIFIPLGVYLRTLTRWTMPALIVAIALASVALEVAQFALAVGSSDLTDVIVNTAGGLAGIGVVALVRRRERIVDACAVGTLLGLIAVGLFIGSFPHLAPGQVLTF